jgi:hypothetical protein
MTKQALSLVAVGALAPFTVLAQGSVGESPRSSQGGFPLRAPWKSRAMGRGHRSARRKKTRDPRRAEPLGDELTNIVQGSPDPALFNVPAVYALRVHKVR